MKKTKNDLSDLKKDKGWFITFVLLIILVVVNNIYLIVNIAGLYSIENALRLTICIIMVILTLLFIFLVVKSLIKRNKTFYIVLLTFLIIFTGIIGFININFNIIYSRLNKVSASYTTYSISLVTTTDNSVESIDNIGSEDIAIINDHDIANGYTFGEEILQTKNLSNTLKEYESYTEILDALLNGDITYAFLPSNYKDTFNTIEGYEKIGDKLKTIYEQSKQEEQLLSNKDVTEPFTILLMGVDSTNESIANTSANGDSLMLITFNPKTLRATMVSIPRDSYIPITCMSNKKNKITHSSWGGESCIINTIEQFTNIDIDYYVKINFTGIVKLVDTLGGIDVDVEYSFCEQNSKRQWGSNIVYVKEGLQTLNGEQALAYSRNRHTNPEYCTSEWTSYTSNDFIRGQHQQDVVKGILSKIKDIRDLDTFYGLLDTISDNMETNMESNTILSFYNVAKDIVTKSKDADTIDELINIQRLYISGYDANIYDYSQITGSGMKMALYNFVPYQGSVNDVVKAMKINLELEQEEVIKTFSYDISSPYEATVIGQGSYSEARITLLPDFTGKTKSYVESYASAHNLKITFVTQTGTSYTSGTVISQDPPARMDLDNISSTKGLTITIASGEASSDTETFDYTECSSNGSDQNNNNCTITLSINKSKTYFDNIKKNFSFLNITVIEDTEENTDSDLNGKIKSITVDNVELESSKEALAYLFEDQNIVITYYKTTVTTKPSEETETGGEAGESGSTGENETNTEE